MSPRCSPATHACSPESGPPAVDPRGSGWPAMRHPKACAQSVSDLRAAPTQPDGPSAFGRAPRKTLWIPDRTRRGLLYLVHPGGLELTRSVELSPKEAFLLPVRFERRFPHECMNDGCALHNQCCEKLAPAPAHVRPPLALRCADV